MIREILRLEMPPSPRGFRVIAKFNLNVMPGLVLYDYQAVQTPSGGIEIYPPPTKNGSRAASLSPELRAELAKQLQENLEGNHDQQHVNIIRRSA